ncbi:UNVERIFIED_CONTAM: hypothetical protein PYX00_005659 [Menopon gallinae]|uniref:DNA polymerase subunit gamma-1 n=1 Tax=Menopon gallinae TaxID=328185 RepID=A0AAW2HSK2_9NEOP
MIHRPVKNAILIYKPKIHVTSTCGIKSISHSKSNNLIQYKNTGGTTPHGFELRSAEQELKMSLPKATEFVNVPRVNEVNIQMLSQSLYEQIFGCKNKEKHKDSNLIEKAVTELKKHGLWTEQVKSEPDVSLKLPQLKGNNIEDHFWIIGSEQSEPYKKLMCDFIQKGIPDIPKVWRQQKGWTKYKTGEEPCSVPYPDADALVFDVEVSVKVGDAPVLAVAVSADSWYGWVSPYLSDKIHSFGKYYVTDMLIPMEPAEDRHRIIVGHNVSYDRARVKEQYYIKHSSLRFMDTMSLHISIGGASSVQKTMLKNDSNDGNKDINRIFCLASLADVYSLYCNKKLSKDERKVFTEGTLEDVANQFQELIAYCANDVKATFEVFQVLFPIFLERFPHPVTLAGMLEMGMAYLPVNANWEKYIKDSQEKFDDVESEMSFLLAKKCDQACALLHNDEYKNNLWLWDEDWSTQQLKLTKRSVVPNPDVEQILKENEDDEELQELMKRFRYLYDLKTLLPVTKPLLPGYPSWYRKLCRKPDSQDWTPGPYSLHTTLTISPKILNLTYENYPLHYVSDLGWGILVADLEADGKNTKLPFKELREITLRNISAENVKVTNPKNKGAPPYYNGTAIWCDRKIDDCCYFFKLPHKDGGHKNVGQPLSKSFSSVLSFDRLTGPDIVSDKGLVVNNMLAYWRNNRDRILGQMVVWLKPDEIGPTRTNQPVGAIIPKVVVCGTLTRRAVESTWLTASKSASDRLGSELRSMVQAPPGYHFVGADVDSQELWIASLIGDSNFSKLHGGTPFGWMTISGTKQNGTDLHSITAKATGISREHAKVINYARIYGAGVSFAQKLLQQFNPSMSASEVKEKAMKMYSLTKGTRNFKLKKQFANKFNIPWNTMKFRSLYSAMNFAKKYQSSLDTVFENTEWEGGTESAVFNELERIAGQPQPETPFLRSRLSRALEPRFGGDDQYMNTRINWVVQSGAVDFLHLMLVCMRWLTNGQARYCLSFHDEVRYLIPSEHRYQAALAMQITNLFTRSFFAHRMGLYDLPLSVAFFSSVEIDKTMRKEASDDCTTPSNPHGLEKGYNIPKGESLTIYNTVKESGGDLSVFDIKKCPKQQSENMCSTKSSKKT